MLCRDNWEPGVPTGPVEVKPEWRLPQSDGVSGLNQCSPEQLPPDSGGPQPFQEQGKGIFQDCPLSLSQLCGQEWAESVGWCQWVT